MNRRERVSALILLGATFLSLNARAQPADPAGAPPAADQPAGDMPAAPAAPPVIVVPPPPPPSTTSMAMTSTSTTTTTTTTTAAGPVTTISPVKIDSPSTTIKFGLLAQPQYEAAGSVALDGLSHNLFLRRTRVLLGGTLFGVVDYFFDTDFGNLFKAAPVAGAMGAPATSVKATPGMNIQDIFVTYKPMGDMLKVDVGYMLPPLSHNAVQGAATLYGWDYFAYTFQHTNSFGSSANPVGRDVGVQLRGLVLGGHLEYRAGLFQGLRNGATATDVGSRNFFRGTARVQINLLDAEPGFFYAGTYFGAKKILSLGGSYDFQDNYKYWAIDGIADLPLGPGVFTAQVNVAQWNGGSWIPALVKQTAIVGEVGYNISAVHVSPIFRFEKLMLPAPAPDQTRIAFGLAFWPYLHNSNLKAFYTRITQDGAAHGANQFNLQWQVYFF